MKSYNLPTILLGGGGYTIENVARAWTYDTGVAVGANLDEDVPFTDYLDYFAPNYKLKIIKMNVKNTNTTQETDGIIQTIFENLRGVNPTPSVAMEMMPDCFKEDKNDDEVVYKRALGEIESSDSREAHGKI